MKPLTITTGIQIHHTSHAHVHHAEKALVLFLEFLLVEDLYCEDALLVDSPSIESASYVPHLTPAALHAHIEAFIPVRIQCLLDYAGCFRLLAADGSDREGIGESCIEAVSLRVPGSTCP